ncbi:hypothetical protein [Bifidobacterium pseudolongum]|uniref:hypothetical protein n=1 Tax=Bifidobacterium pseudolongum TaxID=1694 RepID=UPI0022E19732|nr:hypothetical protein [Bifidobacterium pseudolongum]
MKQLKKKLGLTVAAIAATTAFVAAPAAFAATGYYTIGTNQSINAGSVSGSTSVTTTRSAISVYSFSSQTYCSATQDGITKDGLVGVNTTCSMIATGSATNRNDWTYYKSPI